MKTFENLPLDKQNRILEAAYKEFAHEGYEKASTNRIVKEAEIGKGMLFYYFNNKENLFHYLINYGLDFVEKEYLEKIKLSEIDFLEKYKQVAILKLKAYYKRPYIFHFFGTFYINKEVKLPKILEDRLEELKKQAYALLFDHVDNAYFREDIEPNLIYQMIHWTMDGYEKKLLEELKGKKLDEIDLVPYYEDFYNLIDTLKKLYYKSGGNR